MQLKMGSDSVRLRIIIESQVEGMSLEEAETLFTDRYPEVLDGQNGILRVIAYYVQGETILKFSVANLMTGRLYKLPIRLDALLNDINN